MTQYGFYFDSSKCTGCKTCHVACKDRFTHLLHADDNGVSGVSEMSGVIWRRVTEFGGGTWVQNKDGSYVQDVFAYYTSIGCNHCNNPVCVKACPTGAMHKRSQDGLVHVAKDLCIGCNSCAEACPYDAPQLDPTTKVMTKCDGCYDRLMDGLKPVCVSACPLRALDFGTMVELEEKYGKGDAHVSPLPSVGITSPNLIIKNSFVLEKNSAASALGKVLNLREI